MKGPIILFLAIIGLVIIGYFIKQYVIDNKAQWSSDSNVHVEEVRIAGDEYFGYAFLHTVEFKKQLAKAGQKVDWTDDGGAYAERIEKLANKEYDCIVLPISQWLEHGINHDFPGRVVAVIAESKGADAIVGFPDVMPNGKVNDLNNPKLKIHYTSASPSSFLWDLTITDFDLDLLRKESGWRNEGASSSDIYDLAKKATKDRDVGDLFTLWDPEATRAVEELGMTKIWGSDQFGGYILDVFVFHEDYVSKEKKKVKNFLQTYFQVLEYYNSRTEEMEKQLKKIADVKQEYVAPMIQNVDWYNLQQNCNEMFDIQTNVAVPSRDGIINAIYSCSNVMLRTGSLTSDVEDPYLLVNSSFLDELAETMITVGANATTKQSFAAMGDKEFDRLTEVGTMNDANIQFQSGTSDFNYQAEEIVDQVAEMLVTNYPNYRVKIKGHTGSGDKKANLALSQERAEVVKQRMIAVHGIDPNRLYAKGMADAEPPRKKPGEPARVYMVRWSRVEFVLLNNDRL